MFLREADGFILTQKRVVYDSLDVAWRRSVALVGLDHSRLVFQIVSPNRISAASKLMSAIARA
jgi:hypothetical protein